MIKVNSSQLNGLSSLTSIQEHAQAADKVFTKVSPPSAATPDSLCFCSNISLIEEALKNGCEGLIITKNTLDMISISHTSSQPFVLPKGCAVWSTSQINEAMSQVLHWFNPTQLIQAAQDSLIHPTALIAPTARLGKNVSVGAFAVIEDYAVIGDNTRIAAHVFIGHHCQIGSHCIISSHTTIGSDGFGFYTDKTNTHHKIAQIGIVVIEDNCEIGSQCAIDRATLTETRIGKGCKFDNFCHVAHNCIIGANGMFAAGFMVAGSTTIGKNVTAGGSAHVTGHVKICDNVVLGGRTGVTSSIEKPGIYSGFPQVPHKESLRIFMTLAHLPKMRKQLNSILKKLGLNEEG